MEELAASTLATLKKSSSSAEAKINAVNNLKSSIKHQRIPENAQATALECLRLSITSQVSSSLVTTGFSGLGHLVKRLNLQEQTSVLFSQRTNLLGILSEKLGDAKEPHRIASSQLFCDLWSCKTVEVERIIREVAIQGSNVRAKIAGIQWVKKMHDEQQVPFRGFVGPIVECLEDADGTVRDTAKNSLVDLFRNARDAAKADLKRQLVAYNVRKSIAQHILSQLQVPGAQDTAFASSTQSSHPQSSHREASAQTQPKLPDAAQEPTLPPSAEVSHIEPLWVHEQRELEDMFRQMGPSFEGKESEDNWKARDNNVLKIRRLLQGNAASDYSAIFVISIKSLLDGILKVANSLRTTMASNGCHLIQELARTLGSAMDSMAEIILRGVEKMCASTKHIAAQAGNATVEAILSNVSYSVRLMQHVQAACKDKNSQPRQFSSNWLKILLRRQLHNKSYFEHSGGLEIAVQCIKKGLGDANPKSKELMRGTYWAFAQGWPVRAEEIMSTLDVKQKQLLEKENPNASKTFTSSVGPTAQITTENPRVPQAARSSLKEAIAARKKEARKMPDRPNSAMSSFTPSRQAPPSAGRSTTKSAVPSQQRVVSNAASQASSRSAVSSTSNTSGGQGSLMSAPMRRPKRPDLPRPFTADPYAGRNMMREETPPKSPPGHSPRPASKGSAIGKPSSHVKSKSTTNALGTNAGSATSSRAGSPKTSPTKSRPISSNPSMNPSNLRPENTIHSPSSRDDNMTVIPDQRTAMNSTTGLSSRPGSGHTSQLGSIDEDNFTMVLPGRARSHEPLSAPHPPSHPTNPISAAQAESIDRQEDAVMVYEDPVANEALEPQKAEDTPAVALEELAVNEHNALQPPPVQTQSSPSSATSSPPHDPQVPQDQNRTRQRSASPTKRALPASPTKGSFATDKILQDSPVSDRAEILKTRRLLSSGTERVRARTLDAHGFRRLQDLIKNNIQSADLQLAPVLGALVGYVKVPVDASNGKEKALRGQALSCLRAVVTLYSPRSTEVKDSLPSTLVGLAEAAASSEGSGILELEKAGDEIIKRIESLNDSILVEACLESIGSFVGQNATLESAQGDATTDEKVARLQADKNTAASTALALSALSRLTAVYAKTATSQQRPGVYAAIRTKLAAFAVRCLTHLDPNVRRKGVDFAVELYGLFPGEAKHDEEAGRRMENSPSQPANGTEKMAFWKLLGPAGEQSCNLLTYYLAKRGRVGTTA